MRRWIILLAGFGALIFYRRRRLGQPVQSGPLILVSNHPNSIVDPVLLTSMISRPLRFLAKEPLFRKTFLGPLLRLSGAVPVFRAMDGADMDSNRSMFDAVSESLKNGDAICLFPEGVSHSEPSIQTLKTGAARMALQAERDAGGTLGVRIQPAGLVYADKHRFKSRAALWVGEPIAVEDLHELDAQDNVAAVRELTERITEGLGRVTLNLDQWEDMPVIELADSIYGSQAGDRIERLKTISRRLSQLRREAPERVRQVERRIRAFQRVLRDLGLSTTRVRSRYDFSTVLRFTIRQLAALTIGLPVAALGMLVWLPPMLLTRFLIPFARVRHDVMAAFKIVVGSLAFVAWYALIVSGVSWWLGLTAGLSVAVLAPPLAFFAGYFWRNRTTALSEAAVFFRLASSKRLRDYLDTKAAELAADLEAIRTLPRKSPSSAR